MSLVVICNYCSSFKKILPKLMDINHIQVNYCSLVAAVVVCFVFNGIEDVFHHSSNPMRAVY